MHVHGPVLTEVPVEWEGRHFAVIASGDGPLAFKVIELGSKLPLQAVGYLAKDVAVRVAQEIDTYNAPYLERCTCARPDCTRVFLTAAFCKHVSEIVSRLRLVAQA